MYPAPAILDGSAAARVTTARTGLTGRELLTRVHGAARDLERAGARAGGRVLVGPHTDGLTRVCRFLAADLLGAATLIGEPSWTRHEYRAVLDDACPDVVVDEPDPVPGSALPDPVPLRPHGDPEAHFYLPTTSGSSGRPRVMTRTRRSWHASFRAFDIGLRSTDRVLVPGPLSSSLFLFATVHALHVGAETHLLEKWSAAEAAEACRHSTVVHLVPPMLAALLSVWQRQPRLREECTVRRIVCGGARVDDALRSRLNRVLPGCELVEYYGSAEHSVVALRRNGEALLPAEGVEVEVRDARHGRTLPRGGTGELWVRSELVFGGYLESGAVRGPQPGWSSVGDHAIHHPDGALTVLGRSNSTITSGARTVSAEEVEAALRGVEGVVDVVVSATPHPRLGSLVTAVVETEPHSAPLPALRSRARRTLEPAKRPRRWLGTTALPRTAAGKPARAHVLEQLAAGTLTAEVLS